ncbi:uncharacterized protein B0I36DRAFT_358453 [Microdochium trichocladiopsis]|uniref:Uncharacterized protein n=1 Tax=Microdochium trichocladiopsis TaxID=1682393 RepID=A0A9P8YGG5_9PEZI|nr:uncharacterized protein B0I36DRAFT_358453 [Microdochium trichocladiopsis]KAH7041267.1 hypothetical protein B0I36DRAFT_358453 [Microdochium trichocladiopsis]
MAENGFFVLHQANGKQPGQAQPAQRQAQPAVQQQTAARPNAAQQAYPHNTQQPMWNHAQMNPIYSGPSVISDVSQGLMTDEDRRKALTSYTAFQWEKIPNKDETSSNVSRKSRWERAIRTQERHISEKDIIKQIRHLDRTTKHYLDKKKDLDPAAQRQITTAQEQLMLSDPDRNNFRWHLAQIDHQLRELPAVSDGRTLSSPPSTMSIGIKPNIYHREIVHWEIIPLRKPQNSNSHNPSRLNME